MAIVCPDVMGEIKLLEYIMGLSVPGNKILRLYSNDVTPTDSTVISDLVEVPTSTGYTPFTLTPSNWSITQTGGVTSAVYPQQTFSFTTTTTAYGAYITDASNNLLWLERFGANPHQWPDQGGTLKVFPALSLS